MSAITLPPVPHWTPAVPTSEQLDWVDLEIIDLSKVKTPSGKAELALKARDAMHKQGFFYVVNHGLEKAQVERMFDIAAVPFLCVSDDEKKSFEANIKGTGEFIGYKPMQYWHIANGVQDRMENYSINRNVGYKRHPTPLQPLLPEIQEFIRFNHQEVVHEIERLLALGLELPEDKLVGMTNFENLNNSYCRFMMYYPRPDSEEVQSNNLWLKGHSDQTLLTILWSQPVSGLQIRGWEDGTWKWVKHIDNALVVNCGDTLTMLSGNYYKSAIHRVIQPPVDQQGWRRLGVFYFCYVDDDIRLEPLMESLLLQREGADRKTEEGQQAPLMIEWRKARTAAYGTSDLKKSAENGIEEEVINGIRVKHYS